MALHNQPQGGLAMRERPDDDRVADPNGWDSGSWDSPYASTRQRGGQNYYQRQW